jgi:cobalt/nickel transport system permease protein
VTDADAIRQRSDLGAGHTHALYIHEHSRLHDVAPEVKIVAALGFVISVAITPRRAILAFGLYALVVLALALWSRVPVRFLALRLTAVLPFIAFAVVIPFVASGTQTEILGMQVSVEGLWGSWNIMVKALLGASVSILLTATTEIPEIIRGLGLLKVPATFTGIATFMIRYLELITDELSRVRVAMTSRGYDPRWLHQTRPIATSAGAMFVRSYERGERVHAAMLARGFDGEMPDFGKRRGTRWEWVGVVTMVGALASIAVVALVST